MPFGNDHSRPLPPPHTNGFATGPSAALSTAPRGIPVSEKSQLPRSSPGAPAASGLTGLSGLEAVHCSDFATAVSTPASSVPHATAPAKPSHHHLPLVDEQWTAAISRYGLSQPSPATFACDLSPSIDSRSTPSLTRSISGLTSGPPSDTTVSTPITIPGQGKRPSDQESARADISSSPLKKPRTRLVPPSGIDLSGVPRPVSASAAAAILKSEGVTSPLFFSNSPNPMSNRALALPPSEDASSLLARLREDAEGVRVVRLARGNVSSASPARSGSTSGSGSWTSLEPNLTGSSRSPHVASLPSESQQPFIAVPAYELLELDDRPVFVVDLMNPHNGHRRAVYVNPALRSFSLELFEHLSVDGDQARPKDLEYAPFKAWFGTLPGQREPVSPSFKYAGKTWTFVTLRGRFRIFYGHAGEPVVTPPAKVSPIVEEVEMLEQQSRCSSPSPDNSDTIVVGERDYFGAVEPPTTTGALHIPPMEDTIMTDDMGRHHTDEFTNHVFQAGLVRSSFDWTRITLTPDISEHIHFARSIDWASTSLGPIEDWGADLRAMANMVMGSPHPAAMYWGPENVTIYNQAYIELAGQKHPQLMGQRYQDAWEEIWDDIAPTMQSAWESGQSTMKNDNQLFINRYGFLEEAFFSWSLVPLVGSEGQVVGVYNPAFENTRRKVNERRMLTLREVGEKTAAARDVRSFWPRVKQGLEYNEYDVPFALIYSVRDDNDSEISSMHSGSATHPPQLQLEGRIGVPADHPSAAPSLDLRTSTQGFAPFLRQVMTLPIGPIILSEETGTLPHDLLEGMDWKGFGDPPKTVVVLPVHPTTAKESVVGFIIMGTNPRRPYDEDYQLFNELLSRQLATSLASVVLFEEEIKRGQRAAKLAAMDREELRSELILRRQEAVESEYKFTRMAEFAPVGMFIANSLGKINFANDMWWQISRHPRTEDSADTWMASVRDEDRSGLEHAWDKLVREKEAITVEFRFKCSRQNGDHTIDTWVLLSAYPERDEDGNLKSIFGCITDISPQKWAEAFQKERREEAVELKRQQENFIDMTSHEMRNPLSAILQCADEIINTVNDHRVDAHESLQQLLDSCLEAASTINLCASHQHRIVDDILTLSKLDSQLLTVTPDNARPVVIVQTVLKMFQAEAQAHDIHLQFDLSPQFSNYQIDWVKLDQSRLQQVLINLMTNAIKFTQNRETRKISLTLSASKNISEVIGDGPEYFPTRREDLAGLTKEADWGSGEEINLHFSVQDTGPGLQEDEKKLLFQRFSQASPRTHVQYGGSGLGLFISRMLTELQGGQIGVVSEKGLGSTFSFYIKCRRTEASSAEPGTVASPTATRTADPSCSVAASPTPGSTTIARRPSQRRTLENLVPGHDVLIVEDNIVNQKVLQRQLQKCGNTTHVANHGGEAIEALKRSRYWSGKQDDGYQLSIILMDLEMPVMDGMTCAKRIRQLEEEGTITRHIPIIAVTAYARPEQIEDAKAAGIDDVISKPFRIPVLSAKIDELTAKYRHLST